MGAELDLDDVAAQSPLAMRELAELRNAVSEISDLSSRLRELITDSRPIVEYEDYPRQHLWWMLESHAKLGELIK